jgi:hypothetical protein
MSAKRVEHRTRGLADGNYVNRGGLLPCQSHLGPGQGASDQASAIGCSNRRADDRPQVLSECGAGQLICFGSAQAVRPVTTSNCRRRLLTT